MREHMGLYRGKRKKDEKWVNGAFLGFCLHKPSSIDGQTFIMEIRNDMGRPMFTEVDPENVGECTGLRDLNKKLIFEGDIVKFTEQPFGHVRVGVVCFVDGCFCIKYTFYSRDQLHRIGGEEQWHDMGASGKVTYQYEVIGNAVDNPELLKGVRE